MKKIIALIMAIAVIASMGMMSSFASFDKENWPEFDAIEEAYDFTKYAVYYETHESTDITLSCGQMWFSSEEAYVLQTIELKEWAEGIAFGCGGGDDEINIAIYELVDDDAWASVEGKTPIISGTAEVFHSSLRTSLEFDEPLAPGAYALQITVDEGSNTFWLGSSEYATDMQPQFSTEYIECNDIANGVSVGTVSYQTFTSKDFVAPDVSDTTEAPEIADTAAPATDVPATEVATENPTEAATEEAESTEETKPTSAPTEEAKVTEAPTKAPAAEEKSGCGSVIAGGFAIGLVMAAATVFLKKRR